MCCVVINFFLCRMWYRRGHGAVYLNLFQVDCVVVCCRDTFAFVLQVVPSRPWWCVSEFLQQQAAGRVYQARQEVCFCFQHRQHGCHSRPQYPYSGTGFVQYLRFAFFFKQQTFFSTSLICRGKFGLPCLNNTPLSSMQNEVEPVDLKSWNSVLYKFALINFNISAKLGMQNAW